MRIVKTGLCAFFLFAACAGPEKNSSGGEGNFSLTTIRAVDSAILQSSEFLLQRQRKDGSWDGKVAATALAVQALAAVEPPTAADAAAIKNGIHFILSAASLNAARVPQDDGDVYALAYALAAAHRRPMMEDESGLMGQGQRVRGLLLDAQRRSCSDFQKAIFLTALRNAGEPKDQLKISVEALGMHVPSGAPACEAFISDPEICLSAS